MADGRTFEETTKSPPDVRHQIESEGWGEPISCFPGQLAYDYDEQDQRHPILDRMAQTKQR